MNLAGEEEKETCTGKRLRSHDSTTAWGSSSSDAADAAGETERTLTKQARRRPAGAQAAEMEAAQKKRLREGKLKEDEQEKSVKQKLEGDPDAANPLSFRGHFYAPTKPFAGNLFDTYYFNLLVMWVMIIMLYGILYYDGLLRIMNAFEKLQKKSPGSG